MTNPKERQIPISYDRRGNPSWSSTLSAPDDSIGVCTMVPDRIIPVIFVPGVMGSNLISKGGAKWLMDSDKTLLKGWVGRGPQGRKRHLQPKETKVYDGGALPTGTPQTAEELKRRGWGEVGAFSYSSFLVWLENNLNDYENANNGIRHNLIGQALGAMTGEEALTKQEVALSYRYRFPVFACGYNWLDSNIKSAERLSDKIEKIIARYKKEKKKCEKVIIVTHSMGGLVARCCSELLKDRDGVPMREKILGISHGVMPDIGAAATYKRMKTGAEKPPAGGLGAQVATWLSAKILGEDAAEMTAVLSSAPGPLQLLPTPEYGNGWLKIKDGGQEYSYPTNGDPYGEIYTVRGKWWSMCEDKLINPLNMESDPTKRRAQIDKDWKVFADIIIKLVKPFHEKMAGQYHPNTFAFFGSATKFMSYGCVGWSSERNPHSPLLRGASWPVDVIEAHAPEIGVGEQLKSERIVLAKSSAKDDKREQLRLFTLDPPDENGDGTVPHRSGIAPKAAIKSIVQVVAGHEPAYKEGQEVDRVRNFTMRAIVKIAQDITNSSLRYD